MTDDRLLPIMGGQIVEASIVPVPRQRNCRDDNFMIKAGEVSADLTTKPGKRRQKDTDARWAKKHGRSHFGQKRHIGIDRRHKLVRRYHVTPASVRDNQVFDDVPDFSNTARSVWADRAYRSAEIEAKLIKKGFNSHIHRKARRGKPLSDREQQGNKIPSEFRARVEHVFDAQANDMGGALIRCIGIARAKARIGLRNLACNMRRLTQLEKLHGATT